MTLHDPQPTPEPDAASAEVPRVSAGFAPIPVWLVPAISPGQAGSGPVLAWPIMTATGPVAIQTNAQPPPMVDVAASHNQRLLILIIVAAILIVHLPWLAYLVALQGCWGGFIDLCFAASAAAPEDPFAEAADTPFLFARIAFFMLRVQAVLSSDWTQMSQALQVSTGLGSFMLTKIIAAQGRIAQGNLARVTLAGACAMAFIFLFWAEITLTGSTRHAELGDLTVLAYIDQELPADFISAGAAKAGLLQYLQILRLADALILGAALAMPKSIGKAT
jgi:hypothetical protein